ncbi:uncharacterized protein LOC132359268 [Balaenoptera ricei]|uniref:uncharacterized protein LOC132359268 n=1 Tax=Balaenoptera ricei TaxID=2746895 RepID=UPI0028BD2E09|nr:uncharacterized protein LOC132359268 [Balaenoptera ricei]
MCCSLPWQLVRARPSAPVSWWPRAAANASTLTAASSRCSIGPTCPTSHVCTGPTSGSGCWSLAPCSSWRRPSAWPHPAWRPCASWKSISSLPRSLTHLYLNIPTIAHHEWHPFTISSAPEQKDTIWLHIQSQGQWTNRLYESFKKSDPVGCGSERLSRSLKMRRSQRKPQGLQPQPIHTGASAQGAMASNKDVSVELMSYRPKGTPQQGDEGLVYVGTKDGVQAQWEAAAEDLGRVSEVSSENHRFCNIKCYIDGPYGTPNRRIFASEHAVLIGTGVGITPFASILQRILYRHQKRTHICPNCQHSGTEGVPDADRKLLKVDFIWINRG